MSDIATEIQYYYDSHPTEEDLMGESTRQHDLNVYLENVLKWQYRDEVCFVTGNLNIYNTPNTNEKPLEPDVAVFKGVAISEVERGRLRSWKLLLADRPPPTVVFEVASDGTWKNDLLEKPAKYQVMGVKEYFTYDPDEPQNWRGYAVRLLGWRYSASGGIHPIQPNGRGWLWSEELDSWLVPDGAFLRFYDRQGQQRLTEAENYALRAETERQRAEAEKIRAETERQRAEAEKIRAEKLAAKLRELKIDPDSL